MNDSNPTWSVAQADAIEWLNSLPADGVGLTDYGITFESGPKPQGN